MVKSFVLSCKSLNAPKNKFRMILKNKLECKKNKIKIVNINVVKEQTPMLERIYKNLKGSVITMSYIKDDNNIKIIHNRYEKYIKDYGITDSDYIDNINEYMFYIKYYVTVYNNAASSREQLTYNYRTSFIILKHLQDKKIKMEKLQTITRFELFTNELLEKLKY